ncbi:hypothetical protein [Hyperthermus butylicus]|uniref:hypothetical protein n=1 Tax=Hyperthermus butylicus TaxID=54248 RepID=UPI00064FF765|nr:hypothetical protein [Hyperthermus butylicus]
MKLKPESRLLLFHSCGDIGHIALVFRGSTRVEALFFSERLDELLRAIRSSTFIYEVRIVWPQELAQALGLRSVEKLEDYLGRCMDCFYVFVNDLCRGVSLLLAHASEQNS